MKLRGWVLLAMMGASAAVCAQQAAPPSASAPAQAAGAPAHANDGSGAEAQPQLSPGAAYEQAMRPLDIVRNATANWSDAEKNALGVAMQQAMDECKARDPKTYAGNDLLAYLQLCTFGWQWNAVQSAAWLYINARHRAGSDESVYTTLGLTQAYAYEIKASLSLNDDVEAGLCSQSMLREVPYTALVSSATGATIRYQQIVHARAAQGLAAQRYSLLVDMLRARGAADAPAGANDAAAALPLHQLYADAVEWPAMMQSSGLQGAEQAMRYLEESLPAKMPDDDTILIGAARRRYQLLGATLPRLAASADLGDAKLALPEAFGKSFGAGEVLLVFPDWCAQCVGMGTQFAETAQRLGKKNVRFYAVLAQDDPAPAVPTAAKTAAAAPKAGAAARAKGAGLARLPGKAEPDPQQVLKTKTAADLLLGTPTLVVPMAVLKELEADDFPWLVLTDGQGVVRFVQVAPENALEANSLVDQVVDRMLQLWPAGAAPAN